MPIGSGLEDGMEVTPVHFLLRVPRETRIEGYERPINTIEAHAKKVAELGHVAVARGTGCLRSITCASLSPAAG